MFATSSFAGEKEDVSKCISAAKRYADVTLSRSNYKYDGGWIRSDITWHGSPSALCELGSEVRKLVINGQTYIIDGFAGKEAQTIYSIKRGQLEAIKVRSEDLAKQYSVFLDRLRTRLQGPKPDLDKIEGEFDAQVSDIKLRLLGSTSQLEAAFNGDAVSEKLREKIKELEDKNLQLYQQLRSVHSENKGSTQQEIQKLRAQLSKAEKSIESYRKYFTQKDALNQDLTQRVKDLSGGESVVEKRIEAKYKDALDQLETEVAILNKELLAYKTPIAPLIDKIIFEINNEQFNSAYARILSLRELPTYDEKTNIKFINAGISVVKPIPASEHERNLAAYKFLLRLSPENSKYLEKVNLYEQKISDAEEKKKFDAIVALISGSDDLDKYRKEMAEAALELIKTGKCSRKQIKDDNGGWWKSGERKGQYFMDCGAQRVWFDPKARKAVYADRPVPEVDAAEICKNAIREKALAQPNFHYFDSSYTVHNPRMAVTYVQGFDVKNAFGAKINYRAYCLIQPSGQLDLSLALK